MKKSKSKKLFLYKNKIILLNGASIKKTSCKFSKNFLENFNFFFKNKTFKKKKFKFYIF
jgi:hypothetical protein